MYDVPVIIAIICFASWIICYGHADFMEMVKPYNLERTTRIDVPMHFIFKNNFNWSLFKNVFVFVLSLSSEK